MFMDEGYSMATSTITSDSSLPQAWRPPMGWNSWDSYGTTITEDEVLANARFMAEHLRDAGWDTLVIDAGWFDPNAHAHGYSDGTPLCIDEYGRQVPDERRFPSAAGGNGLKPLADEIHAFGRSTPKTSPTWTTTACGTTIITV